jgi:hypothetical protein
VLLVRQGVEIVRWPRWQLRGGQSRSREVTAMTALASWWGMISIPIRGTRTTVRSANAAYVLVLVLGLRKAAALSGMGSHVPDASVFVSPAGRFCGVVLVAAGVGVVAHLGWWAQAAIVGAAGSIVVLLLTFRPWWLLALAIDIAIVVLSWRTLGR